MSAHLARLADLAKVPVPCSDGHGAAFLLRVAQEVAADLDAVGPGLHFASLGLAVEAAVPASDEHAFSAALDLGLWAEDTEEALEEVGRRLASALLAEASWATTWPAQAM
jgi:hypothetical protein